MHSKPSPYAPPTLPVALPYARLVLPMQEIKAAKLQQKLLVKSVAELQRNSSGAYAELAGDIASLAARLAKVRWLVAWSREYRGGEQACLGADASCLSSKCTKHGLVHRACCPASGSPLPMSSHLAAPAHPPSS